MKPNSKNQKQGVAMSVSVDVCMTIEVAFRYNKKYDYVEMFYYDEYRGVENSLISFCMEEGHGKACYEHYLSLKPLDTKSQHQMDKYRKIVNYYTDIKTKLRVMKRLKRGVCSYA
jgi:hypothetical protein